MIDWFFVWLFGGVVFLWRLKADSDCAMVRVNGAFAKLLFFCMCYVSGS